MKIGVIGKGTAGTQAVAHFHRWIPNVELHWYYDPSIPTKPVGEGSNLALPKAMAKNFGFTHHNLKDVDGTFKIAVYKENWGVGTKPFFHDFSAPFVGYHFDAKKLQDFIFEKFKNSVSIHEGSFSPEDVDCDFVIDCSGKPTCFDEYETDTDMVLNAVYVSHCNWEEPRFNYTLTIARPYGWVFGIPLKNRCSIGYMYNTKFNSLEEVKADVQNVLEQYGLVRNREVAFDFKNYYRKENFSERVAYNGDRSFFLEPLEATSTSTIDSINRLFFDVIKKNKTVDLANDTYKKILHEISDMIMLHYIAGSPFDTEFWKYATHVAEERLKKSIKKEYFKSVLIKGIVDPNLRNPIVEHDFTPEYGTWCINSFYQNINGLNITPKILNLINS